MGGRRPVAAEDGAASAIGEATGKAAGEVTCAHPFLTPVDEFNNVARGNPKPHTLTGQALIDARMTPDTWRLEITADPVVDPPHVQAPATVEQQFTIDAGTAIDLPMLMELGRTRGVKYVKALQCLNIPAPLGQGLWEGVPLRDVLSLCGRINNVRRLYYCGFHNNDPEQVFQSSLSYSQAMETAPGELPVFLAYRLNGQPIPPLRGGPVRMIVPWAHGFKSIKWLQQISLTNDYRINDTYALQNNDPDSPLKTAAYLDDPPREVSSGTSLIVTGRVISGLSGLRHVEYWIRPVGEEIRELADDDPELLNATWQPARVFAAPDWNAVLPEGTRSKDLLGFDRTTGQPLSWPLRYGMAGWYADVGPLGTGRYEIRARAVDGNGFAQPEPRPQQKSGKNAIPVRAFKVV